MTASRIDVREKSRARKVSEDHLLPLTLLVQGRAGRTDRGDEAELPGAVGGDLAVLPRGVLQLVIDRDVFAVALALLNHGLDIMRLLLQGCLQGRVVAGLCQVPVLAKGARRRSWRPGDAAVRT